MHTTTDVTTPEQTMPVALAVTAVAVAAMAVDHLMGDDPGLEDVPTFAIAAALSIALAAVLFGRFVSTTPPARAATRGLWCSVLAVVPGIALLWLGLPFVLAGAGVVLGLRARRHGTGGRATAAIVIGVLVVLVGAGAYLGQAVVKAT